MLDDSHTPLTRPELPACAAIRCRIEPEGEIIIAGRRHPDCLKSCMLVGLRKQSILEQGFMTTLGRFVGREIALKLRQDARLSSVDPGGYRGDILFSEDLY